MNKFLVVVSVYLVALATSCLAQELRLNSKDWIEFKENYDKSYANRVEEITRAAIFAKNKKYIDEFNANSTNGYKLGLNSIADRTDSEYRMRLGSNNYKLSAKMNSSSSESLSLKKHLARFPKRQVGDSDSLDWRKSKGRVSKVKDQGDCAAGWAFSVVGSIEGIELKATKDDKLVPLSVQSLIDCSKSNHGCSGGFPDNAFEDTNSMEDEASYPYEHQQGQCRFDEEKSVMQINGYSLVESDEEEDLQDAVASAGPVSVGIDASSPNFKLYKSGVYKDDTCRNHLDNITHWVLVVGYGTDKQEGDYWIVKNSWGESWGESGYIRMARNRGNMCGIATHVTYPYLSPML